MLVEPLPQASPAERPGLFRVCADRGISLVCSETAPHSCCRSVLPCVQDPPTLQGFIDVMGTPEVKALCVHYNPFINAVLFVHLPTFPSITAPAASGLTGHSPRFIFLFNLREYKEGKGWVGWICERDVQPAAGCAQGDGQESKGGKKADKKGDKK